MHINLLWSSCSETGKMCDNKLSINGKYFRKSTKHLLGFLNNGLTNTSVV